MSPVVLGKLLLLGGCAALGWLRAMELKHRSACLGDLHRTLSALTRELAFSLRPLPDLAAAVQGTGPAAPLFALCRKYFLDRGGESWAEAWDQAVTHCDLPLGPDDQAILRETGQVLGRFDGDSQRQALEGLLLRLETARQEAVRQEDRLFRVYLALGITAGLFACILL